MVDRPWSRQVEFSQYVGQSEGQGRRLKIRRGQESSQVNNGANGAEEQNRNLGTSLLR